MGDEEATGERGAEVGGGDVDAVGLRGAVGGRSGSLPALYAVVLGLGVAMLIGRDPFARLATAEAPVLRSPSASADLYGMCLAPMTLPCTGPLIVSAFVIGEVSGTGALADSLLYCVCFALGFGWPLVLLPLLAAPVQQRATRFLSRHHRAISALSGCC